MRVALRLVNPKSRVFVNRIISNTDIEVLYIVDRNDQKWGDLDDDYELPIISPYKLLQLVDSGEIDFLVILPFCGYYATKDVIEESIEMGVPKERLLAPSVPDAILFQQGKMADISSFSVDEFKSLPRMQYHIADHCNMNCVSCSHFSSLIHEERFMDRSILGKDLNRLKQLVKHIDVIEILGGEPFLNPYWKEYVKLTKKIFEYAQVEFITNGTMVWKLTSEDWDFIKENDVIFRMSLYKPFWNKADEIVNLLKEKKVKYSVNYRVMTRFAYMFLKEPKGTVEDNRINCASDCFQLYYGKMTPCSRMMYIRFFNDYFKTDYPEDAAIESIYEIDDYQQLMKKIERPMALCQFCNIHLNNQRFQGWDNNHSCNEDIKKWIY